MEMLLARSRSALPCAANAARVLACLGNGTVKMKGVRQWNFAISWNNGCRELGSYRGEGNPFLSLHREMNRLFDDAFRSFDVAPFGSAHAMGWPNVEVSETDKEVKVTTELPGLEQKDVAVEFANGMLTISGEKSETEDKERRFSERYYGRFERRIPVVKLPKSPTAKKKVKKIAIKSN